MQRRRTCARIFVVAALCAGCDAFLAEDEAATSDRSASERGSPASSVDDRAEAHDPTNKGSDGGDVLASLGAAAPGAHAFAANRMRHYVAASYEGVDLWRDARAQCSASEGRWQPVLASCGCPPRTVFMARRGCVSAPIMRPRGAGCDGPWAHLPTSCLREIGAGGLTLRLNWGSAKRPKAHFAAHAEHDWTRWFTGSLMLPDAPTALHLVNGKRFAAPVLAWLGFDANEPLPMAAPFSARAAMHEGDDRVTAGTCDLVLKAAQADPNVIVPMCEGISTTLSAIRRPGTPQAAVLRALTVSVNDQAKVAQVVGTYAWQGIFSTYHLPWMHGIAPTRFVITRHSNGQRVTAFLSPSGTVHAWAVDNVMPPVQMLFDDVGKLVH